jgi:signal transduction histidine kinase
MERYSDIIMINNEMILTLINDVLDTAGMETGTIKLDPKPTSLQQICSIAINVVEHLANPGVIMKFENEGDKDFVLNTDAARVEQVLINLLKNATKFTSRGSITLGYKVDKENKQVIFSVTDTGIGIPADKMKMIFNRFEKVNNFSQGSGLGLHICRLIANMVNGEVSIDPNYRNGARFLFIHPIS